MDTGQLASESRDGTAGGGCLRFIRLPGSTSGPSSLCPRLFMSEPQINIDMSQ
jgi:hypothetical protein